MNSILKNPRTTSFAIVGWLSLFFGALNAQFDGKEDTVPDWNEVVSMGIVAAGLLFARDSSKTSEDVGAK